VPSARQTETTSPKGTADRAGGVATKARILRTAADLMYARGDAVTTLDEAGLALAPPTHSRTRPDAWSTARASAVTHAFARRMLVPPQSTESWCKATFADTR
jgi:hypothetical protein